MRNLAGVAAALTLLASAAAAQQTPAAPLSPSAQPTEPVEVRADSLEYESTRDVWVGRGHVVIDRGPRQLTADWVSFNPTTRKGAAAGNVVIREGEDEVVAEFVHFDVDTLEGILFDGELDAVTSGFRLAGEEVRKTGELTYVFRNGVFTTCRCPDEGREPWTIEAEEADLEIDGYGTARNTTFEVLGVPVIWLPWMIYPLLTERQSGLLFPELGGSSRTGTDVGLPVFWAARHNVNVTFTPRYLFKRGYKQDVAVEYVFGERSGGELEGAVLPNDDEIDEDDPSTPFGDFRWGFHWRHDQWLGEDWRLKVDGVGVSDNLYTFDFRDLSAYREDRFLESVVFLDGELAKQGPLAGLGVVASLWWADDQQNHDDSDRDPFLLQRLPQLDLNLPERPVEIFGAELAPSFDVQYTNFFAQRDVDDVYRGATLVGDLFADTGIDALPDSDERNRFGLKDGADNHRDDSPLIGGQSLDGTEGNLAFDEGEPLVDRGSRLMLNPRVALPFELGDGLVEIYPELGYLGAFYNTDEESYAGRHALTAQLLARTRLRRDFELPFGGGEAVHLFEPQLGWTLVSRGSQSDDPLFVPQASLRQTRVRQLDLFNVTRDFADRLPRTDAVTLALQNRAYRRSKHGYGRLAGDLVLSTQYSFADDRFEPVYLEGSAWPAPSWRTGFIFGYDIDRSEIAEGYATVGWRSESGHDLRLSYRYVRNIPEFFEDFRFDDDERYDNFKDFDRVSQLSMNARWAVTPRWGLTYTGRYSFDNDLSLSNKGGVEYLSRCKCWAVRLELSNGRNRGLEFGLQYTLVGLGKDEDPLRPFQRGGSLDDLGAL